MDWLPLLGRFIKSIPFEKVLFPPRDPQKELQKFASEMSPSGGQHAVPLVPVSAPVSPQEVNPPVERPEGDIATACVPCALGHFSTSAGLLNEAVRFKDDGITSNEILDRVAKVLQEQNTLERVDLTEEKLRASPEWEREIAEEALQQSRRLRHRLESLESVDTLQQAAADTSAYYRKLNREWFKRRLSQGAVTKPPAHGDQGPQGPETAMTLDDAKKLASDQAAKEVEARWH